MRYLRDPVTEEYLNDPVIVAHPEVAPIPYNRNTVEAEVNKGELETFGVVKENWRDFVQRDHMTAAIIGLIKASDQGTNYEQLSKSIDFMGPISYSLPYPHGWLLKTDGRVYSAGTLREYMKSRNRSPFTGHEIDIQSGIVLHPFYQQLVEYIDDNDLENKPQETFHIQDAITNPYGTKVKALRFKKQVDPSLFQLLKLFISISRRALGNEEIYVSAREMSFIVMSIVLKGMLSAMIIGVNILYIMKLSDLADLNRITGGFISLLSAYFYVNRAFAIIDSIVRGFFKRGMRFISPQYLVIYNIIFVRFMAIMIVLILWRNFFKTDTLTTSLFVIGVFNHMTNSFGLLFQLLMQSGDQGKQVLKDLLVSPVKMILIAFVASLSLNFYVFPVIQEILMNFNESAEYSAKLSMVSILASVVIDVPAILINGYHFIHQDMNPFQNLYDGENQFCFRKTIHQLCKYSLALGMGYLMYQLTDSWISAVCAATMIFTDDAPKQTPKKQPIATNRYALKGIRHELEYSEQHIDEAISSADAVLIPGI